MPLGFILNVGLPLQSASFGIPEMESSTKKDSDATPNRRSNATSKTNDERIQGSDIIHNDRYDLKLEKSNILMLGPTGSGTSRAAYSISLAFRRLPL